MQNKLYLRVVFKKNMNCFLLPKYLPSNSHVSPLQVRCKSHFPPNPRNGLEAKEERRKSEPIAKAERRQGLGT